MRQRRTEALLRAQTRRHYEEFPFLKVGEPRIRHWQHRLVQMLGPGPNPECLAIDIGCGSGEITKALRRRGAEVVAIDLTQRAVRRTTTLNPDAHVVQGDALSLPFNDESFDIGVSMGVLHHTPDWRRGLTELARVLKPDGRAMVLLYRAFTPYHLGYLAAAPLRHFVSVAWLHQAPRALLSLVRPFVLLQGRPNISDEHIRSLLADQFWTPKADFLTARQLRRACQEAGLVIEHRQRTVVQAHLVTLRRPGQPMAAGAEGGPSTPDRLPERRTDGREKNDRWL